LLALDNLLKTLTPAQQQVYVDTFADQFPEIFPANTRISFADFQKQLTPAARQALADTFVSYQKKLKR
jgi:ABC-type transporter MlaC component